MARLLSSPWPWFRHKMVQAARFLPLLTLVTANDDFCPDSCRDCDELGNCLTCRGYNLLQNYDCVESCSTGFYPSGDECIECPWECSSCTSELECQSCRIDYFYQAGECVDQCSDGYYLSESRCEPCSQDCLECYELNECFRCRQGTLLQENICVTQCTDGFSAVSSDLCLPCRTGCELCDAGSNQQESFWSITVANQSLSWHKSLDSQVQARSEMAPSGVKK